MEEVSEFVASFSESYSDSGSSQSYPDGTVLCAGNDSSAYCDGEGDCYEAADELCWCEQA